MAGKWLLGEAPLLTQVHGAGHVKVMAEDEWAHIVLVAALSFTDDTTLLRKTIVPELLVREALAFLLHILTRAIALSCWNLSQNST